MEASEIRFLLQKIIKCPSESYSNQQKKNSTFYLSASAEKPRYMNFITLYPDLTLRVRTNGLIASYLGITQKGGGGGA